MKRGELDSRLLILVTLALVAFGLVMVYSATSASATVGGSDPIYYLKRQGIYAALGIVLMIVAQRWDYRRLRLLSPVLVLVSLGLLARRARDRAGDQRRPPVDLVRPRRLPAVGAREAGARDLGGRLPRAPAGAAQPARALAAGRRARHGLLRPADARARHGHVDRAARDAHRHARGRRRARARARRRARDRLCGGHRRDLVRAVPPRALLRVPPSVARRPGHRLPARAGDDLDGLRRHLRRRARPERRQDLLPPRGAHRHDARGDRRGARARSASRP